MFSGTELIRYQRHLGLAGFGPEAQSKLSASSVLVVGAGGLGCPALLYLAAAGVGRLVVIDPDRVELSNLQRQVLFTTEDIGQPKAEAAARRLRMLNPEIAIDAIIARLDQANALALVRAADLVVDGSDNFATRYLVNDACVLTDRPFVHAAVEGFEGQASVFNWRGGPTYRCLFPAPPPPGAAPSCTDAGVLGVLPGLLGTIQATEAIKLLTGIGEPLAGRVLLWDARSLAVRPIPLVADPRAAVTDPVPHGLERVGGLPLAKREHVAVAEKDADGVGHDRLGLIPHRAGRDQHLVPEDLDLRPLVGGDGVLEGQFADVEHAADQPGGGRIVDPFDVDPHHRPALAGGGQLLRPHDLRLLAGGRVAGEQPQRRLPVPRGGRRCGTG